MPEGPGRVIEVQRLGGADSAFLDRAYIACSPDLVPLPGQYVMASAAPGPIEQPASAALLPEAVFLGAGPPGIGELQTAGFWTGPPIPGPWRPRQTLALRGPLGRGFELPRDISRLALVSAGRTAGCLPALAQSAAASRLSVVYFGEIGDQGILPPAVEMYPLEALPDLADWAEYLAVEVTLEEFNGLDQLPGLLDRNPPIRMDVLVRAPMPCGALGKCGVCALRRGREWLLACEDGPVIRLK